MIRTVWPNPATALLAPKLWSPADVLPALPRYILGTGSGLLMAPFFSYPASA